MGRADYKGYLSKMSNLKIVQFVCFETTLDKNQFIKRWEEYQSSAGSDANVTLQQCEGEKIFKYLVQHQCKEGELRFVFSKASKKSRTPRTIISAEQAGGYIVLQSERSTETRTGEIKIFALFTLPLIDLNIYRQIAIPAQLNIYEAYYENCSYAYILEFFVKNKYASELQEEIRQYNPGVIDIYKEFTLSTV